MPASKSPEHVALSTELGFAVVEGIELIFATPGRVSKQVNGAVDGVTGFWTGRIATLLGRRT
jgi:hypothetical protein